MRGSARGRLGDQCLLKLDSPAKTDAMPDASGSPQCSTAESAESLCGFVESTVAPGSLIVTDDWSGYAGLGKRGYEHFAVARVW